MIVPMIILVLVPMVIAMVIAVLVVFAMRIRGAPAFSARGVTATSPTPATPGCVIRVRFIGMLRLRDACQRQGKQARYKQTAIQCVAWHITHPWHHLLRGRSCAAPVC
jgi:hypothetical protein